MEDHRRFGTNSAVGFCLLPSELIQCILLRLTLPEIVRLKFINKSFASILSDRDFIRECNLLSGSTPWLFVYKKRWRQDGLLHGFTDRSDYRFEVPITDHFMSAVHRSEDLYFLTASGNFFLFVSNTRREVFSFNLMNKAVKKIPPSPLGPRCTSSWRRSGFKLVGGPSGPNHFRFMFAELHQNSPILFEYDSETEKWRSKEAVENAADFPRVNKRGGDFIFLNAMNRRSESVVIAVESESNDAPVVLRPRFAEGGNEGEQRLAVGLSWGNDIDRLHVYGDANVMIVRSDGERGGANGTVRAVRGIEVWGLSSDGRRWELRWKVPSELVEEIKRPYWAMMGCLEERNGILRAVLVSNYEGVWDIIWLSYDMGKAQWTWVPVPITKMKGLNMAGITFSSGLTCS